MRRETQSLSEALIAGANLGVGILMISTGTGFLAFSIATREPAVAAGAVGIPLGIQRIRRGLKIPNRTIKG